jgi:hypothetical protein
MKQFHFMNISSTALGYNLANFEVSSSTSRILRG